MEMFELRIVSIQIHENLFQAGTDFRGPARGERSSRGKQEPTRSGYIYERSASQQVYFFEFTTEEDERDGFSQEE